MKKSTNARILAAVTALFFPVAALADEAGESPEVAVELVVIEESEGDMEAVIVGESLAATGGAAGQELKGTDCEAGAPVTGSTAYNKSC